MKEKKIVPMTRINTRIKGEQHLFIKREAKRLNLTEGEVFRLILADAMKVKGMFKELKK